MREKIGQAAKGGRAAIEKLVDALVASKTEYRRVAFGKEDGPKLGKPCSPKQIAALEKLLGKQLPPSYRTFLEVANGMRDFSGTQAVLSVEDQTSPWVKARLKVMMGAMSEPSDVDPFREWGVIPIILGENEHDYVVLDPRKVDKNGEMNFVLFDYWTEEERFSTFTEFLEVELATERRLLKGEMKKTSRQKREENMTAPQIRGILLDALLNRGPAVTKRQQKMWADLFVPAMRLVKNADEAKRAAASFLSRQWPDAVWIAVLLHLDDRPEYRKLDVSIELELAEIIFGMKPPPKSAHLYRIWLEAMSDAINYACVVGDTKRAARWSDRAVPYARANNYICHNAACAYVTVGRLDDALKMCRMAVKTKYEHLDKLRTDKDLGALRKQPAFKALFM